MTEDVILLDPTMDGTRQGGRYGWTDKSICELYQYRIVDKKPWSACVSPRSDTLDAIVRAALLAGLYPRIGHPSEHSRSLDSSVQSHAVALASMVAAAIQGLRVLFHALS